jgi:hypothetical protein
MNDIKNKYYNKLDQELDLFKIYNVLKNGKWVIFSITLAASILVVLYSLSLPNIYQSKSVLVSVDLTNNTSPFRNVNFGAIPGISLGNANIESNSGKALKKLETLSFFENEVLPNINLPELMAVKSWIPETNEVIFDPNIYNEVSNTWVRKYAYPLTQIPSAQESFYKFKLNHVNISQDKDTGFIVISMKHQSPHIAKRWTEIMVSEINSFYRKKDRIAAEKSLVYLNEQISKTNFAEIRQVIADLLRQETQKLTLIEANEAYVFEYIDPPAVMEYKFSPNRALICIFGAIIGGIFSIFVVLFRESFFKGK